MGKKVKNILIHLCCLVRYPLISPWAVFEVNISIISLSKLTFVRELFEHIYTYSNKDKTCYICNMCIRLLVIFMA